MEPRPFRRGDGGLTLWKGPEFVELQWSHALSGVETSRRRKSSPGRNPLQWSHALSGVETSYTTFPSCVPVTLQWSHALSGVETRGPVPSRAPPLRFNGATPFQAWRPARCSHSSFAGGTLQWSHALSGVETSTRRSDRVGVALLQWSHALSGVETDATARGPVRVASRFNGATPFQAWRL